MYTVSPLMNCFNEDAEPADFQATTVDMLVFMHDFVFFATFLSIFTGLSKSKMTSHKSHSFVAFLGLWAARAAHLVTAHLMGLSERNSSLNAVVDAASVLVLGPLILRAFLLAKGRGVYDLKRDMLGAGAYAEFGALKGLCVVVAAALCWTMAQGSAG